MEQASAVDRVWVALDLEATSFRPEEAEILEVAAVDTLGRTFHRYLATQGPLGPDHEAFRLTGIPYEEYQANKVLPGQALVELFEFLGARPLVGHNLLRYDLPLLGRYLKDLGLSLPARGALDTLRLAHLLFPVPPPGLEGYRLGDLYRFFTGQELQGAHRALEDARANLEVLAHLVAWGKEHLATHPGLARAWRELGLGEAALFPEVPGLVKDLLARAVDVSEFFVEAEGKPLPSLDNLGPDLLPTRREAQQRMFHLVAAALDRGIPLLLQAPTGTGKTKGYLYPALGREGVTWVATHTKVLQAQVLDELREVAQRGYRVRAALVKSARDTLCPDRLLEAFLEERKAGSEEARLAVGVLLHYAALGFHDLEALPAYWHFQEGFRAVRARVGTNPIRCREACPFFAYCAFQRMEAKRKGATLLVTNQAYLLQHFLGAGTGPTLEATPSLVVDEAHHLEEVATEALTEQVDGEGLRHLLERLADQDRGRGLLLSEEYLRPLREEARAKAKELAEEGVPRAAGALEAYGNRLEAFLKQWGRGSPEYGLDLPLDRTWPRHEAYPLLRREEQALIRALAYLLERVQELRDLAPRSLLTLELDPILQELRVYLDLLRERWEALERGGDDSILYVSRLDPVTGTWAHLKEPVEVAPHLERGLWPRFRGVVLTSATLRVPTEKDPEGFSFLKRILGLPEETEEEALPPSLPYEKATLLVPHHLPEARESTLPRFQRLLHQELRLVLEAVPRTLTLFTSLRRLEEARRALEDLPHLRAPLTRREREDTLRLARANPEAPLAALGSRSFMEGVDIPHLKLVNLERLPFPYPSPLVRKRRERAREYGLDGWDDYYLPKAVLAFVQAFGRLVRDDRKRAGRGAFVLWDKKLFHASYQEPFYRALPEGVGRLFPETREAFYRALGEALDLPLPVPTEEFPEAPWAQVQAILSDPLLSNVEKGRRVAEDVYRLVLAKDRWAKQAEAIQAALEGHHLLALLPTGFGKSLAFQIPAWLQEGLTLVVSPLVALMKDQADRLAELGLPALALHGLMSGGEQRGVLDEVRQGRIRLLYVAPERINRSSELQKLLEEFRAAGRLVRVVFDEAHCLLEWGFDFRPDYLRALEWLKGLGLPMSFFTATLTPEERVRLKEVAGLREVVEVLPDTFHRENLRFVVRQARGEVGKFAYLAQALLWVQKEGGSAIVYATSRAETERLAWALGKLFPGLGVEAYHAGLSPHIRREVQERFAQGVSQVVVATTAFGMGVDKADVRLVAHWRPPLSLEEYIQQAGRAGRDGKEAYAFLLYTVGDWNFLRWMAGLSRRSSWEAYAEALLKRLETGAFRGYKENLLESLRQQLGESVAEEVGEEEDEPEEIEGPPPLGPEELDLLLAGLERAGVLRFQYLPGKVFLFLSPEELDHLKRREPGLPSLLERAVFQGSPREREAFLDLCRLPADQAEELDKGLYRAYREGWLRLYHYREPLLLVERSPTAQGQSLDAWRQDREKALRRAQERLDAVREYATRGRCRAGVLLAHINGERRRCGTCDTCSGDLGPWEGLEAFQTEELLRAYKPLDTLLAFFRWVEERDPQNPYLGRQATLMALRGKDRAKDGLLSPRYRENPLFGHLSFLKPKQLEQAFEEALRLGYLEKKAVWQGRDLFGLTEAGRKRLRR